MLKYNNFLNEKSVDENIKFKPIIDFVSNEIVKGNKKLNKYFSWLCRIVKNSFINFLLNDEDYISLYDKINYDILNYNIKYNSFKDETLKNKTEKLFSDFIKKRSIDISGNKMNPKSALLFIVDWLISPMRSEIINLKEIKTIENAYINSDKWHKGLNVKNVKEIENIKEEEESKGYKLLLMFDDGFYWLDLRTRSCREEADAMGHCGTTSYGKTLYSLRKKGQPHVTVAVGGTNNQTIFQIKGKQNTNPSEKYHKYIIELLSYPNVSDDVQIINNFNKITNTSYGEDFKITDLNDDQILLLYERNPDIFVNNKDYSLKYDLYKKGIIKKQDVLSGLTDVKIINDDIVWVLNDWKDIDNKYLFEKDSYNIFKSAFIDNDVDFYFSVSDFMMSDIIYVFDKETFNIIKNYLIKENISIENSNGDVALLTNKNTKVTSKDLFFTEWGENENYSLENYLLSNSDFEFIKNNKPIDLIYPIKDAFRVAYTDSCYKEMYRDLNKQLSKQIGDITISDKIHIDINLDYIVLLIKEDQNMSYNQYSSLKDILSNAYVDYDLRIELYEPRYGWYGSVTPYMFNSFLSENLC